MLVMTALYLLAGLMRDIGGSFSLHELSGLYRASPLLAGTALMLVLAVSGLPPGSGLWPKVLLVKAALDSGAWWLASAILVSGLLTTVALGRVYTLAFWRDNDRGIALQSATYLKTGFAALIVLMMPIVFIGLYPEPFIRVAGLAASGLLDASSYIGAVFPGDVP
jgi:multicomponent Na+:H+ antiporter subunit D